MAKTSWHMFQIGSTSATCETEHRNMMNKNSHSRSANRRRGVAVVEMAFVIPVMFLLVFGFIEFARMVMVKQALTDAARAGCRKAVLASTIVGADAESTVLNHVQATVANSLDEDTCRVTISPSNLNGMASGTEITTTVDINLSDVSWIPASFLNNVVLQGQSTMKRE